MSIHHDFASSVALSCQTRCFKTAALTLESASSDLISWTVSERKHPQRQLDPRYTLVRIFILFYRHALSAYKVVDRYLWSLPSDLAVDVKA